MLKLVRRKRRLKFIPIAGLSESNHCLRHQVTVRPGVACVRDGKSLVGSYGIAPGEFFRHIGRFFVKVGDNRPMACLTNLDYPVFLPLDPDDGLPGDDRRFAIRGVIRVIACKFFNKQVGDIGHHVSQAPGDVSIGSQHETGQTRPGRTHDLEIRPNHPGQVIVGRRAQPAVRIAGQNRFTGPGARTVYRPGIGRKTARAKRPTRHRGKLSGDFCFRGPVLRIVGHRCIGRVRRQEFLQPVLPDQRCQPGVDQFFLPIRHSEHAYSGHNQAVRLGPMRRLDAEQDELKRPRARVAVDVRIDARRVTGDCGFRLLVHALTGDASHLSEIERVRQVIVLQAVFAYDLREPPP